MEALLHKKMLLVGILELAFIQLALSALPTFITPAPDGSTNPRPESEDAPTGKSIILVEGQDSDGDNITYSIQYQDPISPAFEINTTSGLFKVPAGLDYETTQQYTFRFGISDGGATQESVDFIVNIDDVNDNTPVFNPSQYSKTLYDSNAIGTTVVTVTATDADVSPGFNTIVYSITGGDTNSLFTVGGSDGILTTTKVLTGEGGNIYILTVQASDTTNSVTTTVNVTIGVDYCNGNPCQNGGTCTNGADDYTCTCTTGFGGKNCTTTTSTTTNGPTTTTIQSSSASTSASTLEQRGGGGSSGGGLSAGGIAGIVIAVIVVLAIVIVLIVVYLHKRVPVCGPIIEGYLSERTNSNDDTAKPIEKKDKMELVVVTGVSDTTTTTTTTANKTQDTSRSDKYRTENESNSPTNGEVDGKITENGNLGDKQEDSVNQGQDTAKDTEHVNTDEGVKDNGKSKSEVNETNTSDTEVPLLDKKQDEKSGIKM